MYVTFRRCCYFPVHITTDVGEGEYKCKTLARVTLLVSPARKWICFISQYHLHQSYEVSTNTSVHFSGFTDATTYDKSVARLSD
jgi:hypothetical protein